MDVIKVWERLPAAVPNEDTLKIWARNVWRLSPHDHASVDAVLSTIRTWRLMVTNPDGPGLVKAPRPVGMTPEQRAEQARERERERFEEQEQRTAAVVRASLEPEWHQLQFNVRHITRPNFEAIDAALADLRQQIADLNQQATACD